MKPPPLTYHRAESLEHAVELLEEGGFTSRPLSGGQSLVPMLNMRLLRPDSVIDLNGVDELRGIEAANGHLRIGALTRHVEIERSERIASLFPGLATAIRFVGDRQVRSRGTIGGSLAHADPTAELAVISIALGAEIVTRGPGGEQIKPADSFFLGAYSADLEPGELVAEVRLPTAGADQDQDSVFVEHARRHGDFAIISVAVAGRRNGDGSWRGVRLALGGISDVPSLAAEAGARLEGTSLSHTDVEAAIESCVEAADPLDDIRASARYRKHLIPFYVRQAIERLTEKGGGGAVIERTEIELTVNGELHRVEVEPRRLLVDVIRHDIGLTGTHVGCEQGVCGMCTVLLDDEPVKSCLMLSPQAHGAEITTVESLSDSTELHPLQQAFKRNHALQCGYCTPAFLMTATALERGGRPLNRSELREELAGVLCRCTGYEPIVTAVDEYLREQTGERQST